MASRDDASDKRQRTASESGKFKATKKRKPKSKDQAIKKALKGSEFAKDATESFDANEDEAEYQAKEQTASTIKEIQERRRTSKANFIRQGSISSNTQTEEQPLLPSPAANKKAAMSNIQALIG